jgi:hypothetical protein
MMSRNIIQSQINTCIHMYCSLKCNVYLVSSAFCVIYQSCFTLCLIFYVKVMLIFNVILIYICVWMDMRSRDNAVIIVTGYELDGGGVGIRVSVRAKFFSSLRPDQFSSPPIQ